MCPDPHQNHGRGWRRETGLSPPMKYFTDRSKAVIIFCGSVVLCKSCVCHAFVSVTCWERADLLARACDVKLCFYHFPMWYPGEVWYFIVSFPDFCRLTYFIWLCTIFQVCLYNGG